MTTNQPPPPGWYPDPSNPAYQRYWDGNAWTVVTRTAPTHGNSSESDQTRKSSASKPSFIKSVADWFNTGTAAVKFAKALLGLLAFLGIITIGGAIAGGGGGTGGGGGGGGGSSGSRNSTERTLSATLLQPCDLGACGAVGWSLTQFPSSSSNPPSCPSYPQNSEGHVSTALEDAASGVDLYEVIWKVTDPSNAISTYMNTAQNCSFTNNSGNTATLQADDSAGSYGDESAVFTVGVVNSAFQNETPTITAYDALIARGNLVAEVTLTTGTEGTISPSMLNQVLTTATNKLL